MCKVNKNVDYFLSLRCDNLRKKAMNIIKKYVLTIYCLCLLCIAAACGGHKSDKADNAVKKDTMEVLATNITACSRLYTAQYDVRKIMVYTDTTTLSGNFLNHHMKVALPLSDRKIAIPISATAKAFIDLGKIKRENIIRHGDHLEVILPDPEIMLTSTTIDHQGVKRKVGLLRHDFTDEEMTGLQRRGRDEIIGSLSKTNIVKDAQQNAARLIVPIAVQCGFAEENVTVTFRKDFHPGDFNSLIRQLN